MRKIITNILGVLGVGAMMLVSLAMWGIGTVAAFYIGWKILNWIF